VVQQIDFVSAYSSFPACQKQAFSSSVDQLKLIAASADFEADYWEAPMGACVMHGVFCYSLILPHVLWLLG
jgi:hypothetical protein